MSMRITINGVDYPGVEAMPPDVRKVYDEMRARFPNLAIGEETAPTTIVSKDVGPLHFTASVRQNVVVKGPTFRIGSRVGAAPANPTPPADRSAASAPLPAVLMSRPIEPTGTMSWRFAYGAGVGVAIVVAWWWLFYR